MKRLFILILALSFAASCSKDASQKNAYVAKIDGTAITKEDVEYEIKHLPEAAVSFFAGQEGKNRFVEELVKKELLYAEAKKRGLDKDKDLERKVEDFKKITLINMLLEKEVESASRFTDKELRDFYDKNKEQFISGTEVRISDIVVGSEQAAKKAYERLKGGEAFAKVARSMSIDKKSAKSGGDMGTFKRGQLAPELDSIAFRLSKGEVASPVRMKDGIHIIKAVETKGVTVGFERVKDIIARRLTAEKQRDIFDKFMEGLKKSHKVELNNEVISKIKAIDGSPDSKKSSDRQVEEKAGSNTNDNSSKKTSSQKK